MKKSRESSREYLRIVIMKLNLALAILAVTITGFAADPRSAAPSGERIHLVHQDLSKWDKNGDGKLTGRERDEFRKDKRKEMADVVAAERAARAKARSPRVARVRPALSSEDVGKPIPRGMPKNFEDAAQ